MKRRYRLFCMAGVLGCLPFTAAAQFSDMHPLSQQLREEAKVLFARNDYMAARVSLTEWMKKEYPAIEEEEVDYLMALTAVELRLPERLKVLNDFLDTHRASRYENNVRAAVGAVYYDDGKYEEAIAYFNSCDLEKCANAGEYLYRLADAHFQLKRYKEARAWLSVLRDEPDFRDKATYQMAYIDYLERRYDMAEEGFKAVESVDEFRLKAPLYLADIYLQKADYDRADEVAQRYLDANQNVKGRFEMMRIAGEVAFRRQRYDAAIGYLEPYREQEGDAANRDAVYMLGMSYLQMRAYSKAIDAFDQVTKMDDALAQHAYYNMGLAALALKNRNQARMAFEQAAASNFDGQVKEEALFNYALNLHETSYSPFAESVTAFEKFLNLYPHSKYTDRVNDYLVDVYLHTKSYDAALASIAKIKSPGERILQAKQRILFNIGTQEFAQSRFDEAAQRFTQAIEVGNADKSLRADAFYWRGEANYRREDYAAAASDFTTYVRTADKSPQQGLAYYNLGYTAFKQKRYGQAGDYFTQAVQGLDTQDKATLADAYNRLGDVAFYERYFDRALQNYDKARGLDVNLGDYALFQSAFVKGLQKQYASKITLLNQLIGDYPASAYLDLALYEQGRAYVMMEQTEKAIGVYKKLTERFPTSNNARKAANEIALLYYQNDKYPEAIAAYKKVIADYPGSEEAKVAQRDLKSLYVEINQVDQYLNYASNLPGGADLSNAEKDSLTYKAAENLYVQGQHAAAARGLKNYISEFPQGAFRLDASYYLGLIAYNEKKTDEAADYFDNVLAFPNSKYSANALALAAELAYTRKDYATALKHYKEWANRELGENRIKALEGALKSAVALNEASLVIAFANELQQQPKLSPERMTEATYHKAKAMMTLGEADRALTEWAKLAKDTRTVYGAEAKYQVAQIYFEKENYKAAEKELLDFIDQSTPHAYWLARGFILLSDVYVKMGKKVEARQYLLSLKNNYHAKDDIARLIESRLSKL